MDENERRQRARESARNGDRRSHRQESQGERASRASRAGRFDDATRTGTRRQSGQRSTSRVQRESMSRTGTRREISSRTAGQRASGQRSAGQRVDGRRTNSPRYNERRQGASPTVARQGTSLLGSVKHFLVRVETALKGFIASVPPRILIIGAAVILVLIIGAAVAFGMGHTSGAAPSASSANYASVTLVNSSQAASDAADGQSSDETAFVKRTDPFSVTFASTGDIIFGREVGTYVDMYGGASALANVADQLAAADVTIANVEAPLTEDESEALVMKDVLLISRPAGIESLKNADVTFASLANNHSMDYGAAGLKDTLDVLDGAGILHAGAGMTEEEAGQVAETMVGDVSVAFLSWTDIIPDNFLAYQDSAGVVTARLNMKDACKRVTEAKKTHDIVVVAMHWGIEYEDYIDEYQQSDPAHELADAGADVIIGNHPHVIQGIEFYNGTLISYSQGDFVFDHYSQRTGESFILEFTVTQDGVQNVTATPVYLDDTYGIPSVVTGDHAQSILARLEEISTGMNTTFEVVDDVAYITPTA